jgi:hypothetical protein
MIAMKFDPTIPPDSPDYVPPTTPEDIADQIQRDQESVKKKAAEAAAVAPDKVEAAVAATEDEDETLSKPAKRKSPKIAFDYKNRLYYAAGGNSYVLSYRDDEGTEHWIDINKGSIGAHLRANGCSQRIPKSSTMSVSDAVLQYVETANRITGSGSVAGYQPGVFDFPEGRYAVTSGFSLPEPGDPDPYIGTLIRRMLMDEPDAYDVLMGWLQRFYISLRDGVDAPGQILALLGPPGTGKTWLINRVIARLFGGRIAKPFTWLSGETRFNDDVVGAEVQVVDDEQCPGDRRTRKMIASKIKRMIGEATIRVEGKGQKPVTVCPRWRLVFGANDEVGAMNVFPEGTSDMEGKICFLEIPANPVYDFPGNVLPRAKFDGIIDAAFGGFVREVLEFELPAHLADERWGVVALRTSAAVAAMDEKDAVYNRGDDERLGEMLAILFGAADVTFVEFSSTQLISKLAECAATRDAAKHVLASCPRRTGRLLSKLSERIDAGGVEPDGDDVRVKLSFRNSGGNRIWSYARGDDDY